MGTNLLQVSTWRDFGAIKGSRRQTEEGGLLKPSKKRLEPPLPPPVIFSRLARNKSQRPVFFGGLDLSTSVAPRFYLFFWVLPCPSYDVNMYLVPDVRTCDACVPLRYYRKM